jgi:hypothetical protein
MTETLLLSALLFVALIFLIRYHPPKDPTNHGWGFDDIEAKELPEEVKPEATETPESIIIK